MPSRVRWPASGKLPVSAQLRPNRISPSAAAVPSAGAAEALFWGADAAVP